MIDNDEIIFDAIEFAAKAHRGQFRKSTKIPYITHPLNVGNILIEKGCSREVVVAGILHDTVEDTDITIEEIEKNFGKIVAEIVKGVSEPDKSDTWENRKNHTIEMLKTASTEVILVEYADKLDNIRSIKETHSKIGEKIWERFKRQREKQSWYYKNLANVITGRMKDENLKTHGEDLKNTVEEVFGK